MTLNMYVVSFKPLKSPKLTNDHFGDQNFDFGATKCATIDIDNVLFHYMVEQIDISNVLPQIQ